jgi:hypothetical protein
MDPAQERKAIRINWITQPFAIMSLATGKVSVALLIMRIMGKSTWRRAFLIWAAMAGSVLFCSIAIILTFAQCRPVQTSAGIVGSVIIGKWLSKMLAFISID